MCGSLKDLVNSCTLEVFDQAKAMRGEYNV